MSEQNLEPIEQVRRKATSLESTLNSVRDKTSLKQVLDALEDIDSQLGALPGALARLRGRGYAFKSYLESDVAAVQNEWPATRSRVQSDVDFQRRTLSSQMDDLTMRFLQARSVVDIDMTQAQSALAMVEASAQSLDRTASTAISTLQGMYNSLQSRVRKVQSDVKKAETVLNEVDNACFKLYPNEQIIDVMEGQWLTDQKGGPKGFLFCTDHRLIFEQREEVATKKVLFFATEKQKVQQVAMEAPIGSVTQIKESESGALLLRKDHLEVVFGPQSKVRSAHFILKGDSAEWQRLINRVNAGEMEKERVRAADAPKTEDKPKTALPTHCPACGAAFTQEIVRGMTSIKCQYCGTVTRL